MNMDVFKTAQKVNIHLGYFCKKICLQELSKIARSGHTATQPPKHTRKLLVHTQPYLGRYSLSFAHIPSPLVFTQIPAPIRPFQHVRLSLSLSEAYSFF